MPELFRLYGDAMLEKLKFFGHAPKCEAPIRATLLDHYQGAVPQGPNHIVPPPVEILDAPNRVQTAQATRIHLPGILVFIFVVGMLVLGYWWGQTVKPVGIIRAHLQAIEDGEYGKAYSYLSLRAQEQVSYDEFVTLIQENSVVMEPRGSTFLSRKVNGNTASINGFVEGYSEYVSDVRYVLVKEAHQWKIVRFEWGVPRAMKEEKSNASG